MNFELSDEQVQIRDTFARFCDERIAPRAAEIDEAHAFPRELVRRSRGARFLRAALSARKRRPRPRSDFALSRAGRNFARLDVASRLRHHAVADGHEISRNARQCRHQAAPVRAGAARRENRRHLYDRTECRQRSRRHRHQCAQGRRRLSAQGPEDVGHLGAGGRFLHGVRPRRRRAKAHDLSGREALQRSRHRQGDRQDGRLGAADLRARLRRLLRAG